MMPSTWSAPHGCSTSCGLQWWMNRRAPMAARRDATANPIPCRRLTPVTTAARPASGRCCMGTRVGRARRRRHRRGFSSGVAKVRFHAVLMVLFATPDTRGSFGPGVVLDDLHEVDALESRDEVFKDVCLHIAESGFWAVLDAVGECGKDLLLEVRARVSRDHGGALFIRDRVVADAQHIQFHTAGNECHLGSHV